MEPRREDLYFLSWPATDSFDALAEDAERRARERGCECLHPVFRHFFSVAVVTVVVDHTSPACPLAPDPP